MYVKPKIRFSVPTIFLLCTTFTSLEINAVLLESWSAGSPLNNSIRSGKQIVFVSKDNFD